MENLLDLLIGLALLYLLTAVAASFIVEFGASWTNLRATGLKRFIFRLLHKAESAQPDTDWAAKLYQHGLIQALHSPPAPLGSTVSAPSYIPSQTYASAILDLVRDALAQDKGQPLDLAKVQEKLKAGFKELPPGLVDSLNSAFSKGINSVQALEKELAGQFDAAMERASGWYKRATQGILIGVAFVLALCFNLDIFYVAKRLLQDEALRSDAVGMARLVNPGDGSRSLDELTAALRIRTAVLDNNVEAVKVLKATKDAAARSTNLAALKRLQANNYFDTDKAELDYQLLTTSDPQRRGEAFAALFTSTDMAACPQSTKPAGNEPGADAVLCDWLRYIDGTKDSVRDAAILKFSATGMPSTLPGRVLSPQLAWLTAAAIRAPESEAPLKALQDYLKQSVDYSKQLDASLIAALSHFPKVGWIGDVWPQIEWTALFGWLATALMAGFGAPFWFELLGKLVNLRGVGVKPAPAATPGVKT
ncbi:MAG TPA: hypothetical protein PLM62_01755 [Zoogloea sp.]|nr:hypothetical protein [Zoogloea sp.]